MLLYILDPLLRKTEVVDRFESLIWTERFQTAGEFELVIQSTPTNRALFTVGTRLSIDDSYRVMEVETVEKVNAEDGSTRLKVKGPSLESLLEDRVARGAMADTTTVPKWVITDTPGDIARQIFHDICVTGILDSADIIPYVLETNVLFPADTIVEEPDSLTVELDPTTVYQAVVDLCSQYDLGFRLVRSPTIASTLYFNIYSGCDRTSAQAVLPAVIFSTELENLDNSTEMTTTTNYKNVAYVFSPVGFEVVMAPNVDPDLAGFERRVLLVNATDITDTTPSVATAKMIQRGKDELAKYRSLNAFDGELNQNAQYKYGVDYNLGDKVEMRSNDGVAVYMRVSEQIFASDGTGDRSYPTLTVDLFIDPGSWFSWKYNQFWIDFGATEYWEDQ